VHHAVDPLLSLEPVQADDDATAALIAEARAAAVDLAAALIG
jgi:hypothetical protein